MILDRTVEIYSRTELLGQGSEGIPSYTYQLIKSTRASLQPISLSSTSLAQWGLTDIEANSKIVFIPGEYIDGLAFLVKDLKTSLRYEIRGSNPWGMHTEILCMPYQGGDPI
jgi:hypothetical protein